MQYPTIAQPQYGFGPTMPMMPSMSDMPPAMMNFKEGGLASLAEKVQAAGRNGDTMLAHITPEEAGILQLLGGSGTINPKTGLPEYFNILKEIRKIGRGLSATLRPIERGIEGVAKALGPVGQIAAAYFGGPIGAAIYAGLAAPGNKVDWGRAAAAAALTYGGNVIAGSQNPMAPAYDWSGGASAAPTPSAPVDSGVSSSSGASGVSSATASDTGAAIHGTSAPPSLTPASPSVVETVGPSGGGLSGAEMADLKTGASYGGSGAPILESATPQLTGNVAANTAPTVAGGIGDIAMELGKTAVKTLTPKSALDALKIASTASTVYGSIKSLQELEEQKEEAQRILKQQERAKAEDVAWAESVLRDYPINYQRLTAADVRAQQGMAGGGLASLNAFKSGGNPRFLKGGGDGMSDDIPATIGGRQKAALSDGEFVVPADVVSHLGNGSSRAGAKKLYSMMDNIRKARTGKKRQAPEVRADRYMPA